MKKFKTSLSQHKVKITGLCLLAATSLLAQQNGLNNTASGTSAIELGGNLLRNTNVNLFTGSTPYNLNFGGDGLFGVGNALSAGTLGGSRVLFAHDNSSTSNPLNTTFANSYYSSTPVSGNVTGLSNGVSANSSAILRGIYDNVTGDAYHVVGVDVLSQTSTLGGAYLHFGVRSNASGAQNNWGGQFLSNAVGVSGGVATGVEAIATSDGAAAAGVFRANGGASNGGVFGQAINTAGANNAFNTGVFGETLGNTGLDLANIGVLGTGDYAPIAMGVAGFLNRAYQQFFPAVNAAVYGNAYYSTASTPYAGYFDGDILVTGTGTITGAVWSGSDKNFKKEITPLTNATNIIGQLKPVSFIYNNQNDYGFKFPEKKNYGIIAQELEQVMPELVTDVKKPAVMDRSGKVVTQEKSYKVVNYNAFFGILIANAQEQQKQLDAQKQANESLRQELEEQKQLVNTLAQKAGISTGLQDLNAATLGFSMSQNEPNPFNHETVVKYTLPQSTTSAYMAVYDLTGKQVATFPIADKAATSITLTSEKLAAGIYIYSIVADGKVMNSKRMIVADK